MKKTPKIRNSGTAALQSSLSQRPGLPFDPAIQPQQVGQLLVIEGSARAVTGTHPQKDRSSIFRQPFLVRLRVTLSELHEALGVEPLQRRQLVFESAQ